MRVGGGEAEARAQSLFEAGALERHNLGLTWLGVDSSLRNPRPALAMRPPSYPSQLHPPHHVDPVQP